MINKKAHIGELFLLPTKNLSKDEVLFPMYAIS